MPANDRITLLCDLYPTDNEAFFIQWNTAYSSSSSEEQKKAQEQEQAEILSKIEPDPVFFLHKLLSFRIEYENDDGGYISAKDAIRSVESYCNTCNEDFLQHLIDLELDELNTIILLPYSELSNYQLSSESEFTEFLFKLAEKNTEQFLTLVFRESFPFTSLEKRFSFIQAFAQTCSAENHETIVQWCRREHYTIPGVYTDPSDAPIMGNLNSSADYTIPTGNFMDPGYLAVHPMRYVPVTQEMLNTLNTLNPQQFAALTEIFESADDLPRNAAAVTERLNTTGQMRCLMFTDSPSPPPANPEPLSNSRFLNLSRSSSED